MLKRPALRRERAQLHCASVRKLVRKRLQFEQLERRLVLSGDPTLVADSFAVHQNGPRTQLDVLANDIFGNDYIGQKLVTSVSYGSQGGRIQLSPDRHAVLYTPPADYSGAETFVYAVDGKFTAQVQINIEAPLQPDQYSVVPDGIERQLNVMENDPFWSGYLGPRRITSISVGSAGGAFSVAPDGHSIRYTAALNDARQETFVYVVDDVYPAQVSIDIASPLKCDRFELVQHTALTQFNVLENDPFWPGYLGGRVITHVTASQSGATITISSDGKSIQYTAGATASWDSFTYVVDGKYEATVQVVLYRPVVDDWLEVDENSTEFYFDVIGNDMYRDLGGSYHDVIDRVTSVTQPVHGGIVSIAPNGLGILYTPQPGFKGSDSFTYLADGVHEATVSVQVKDPVRDDDIRFSIVQDTPGGVLDVLANDFIGNGYQGARRITALGPTVNGGTISISDNGKLIRYMPAPGYTGEDHFTYTVDGVLEANVTVNVQSLTQSDSIWFYPDPSHPPYEIDVLANDLFDRGYLGLGVITNVELVRGNGQVTINRGRTILFAPAAADYYTIRYTVDGQYEGTLNVWIKSAVDPDHFVVDENSQPNAFDVRRNDFYLGPNGMYYVAGPRLITGVTQSARGGLVTIDPSIQAIHYTPPANYYGADSFTYTVDNFMTTTVAVDVIRRVRDDQFRVDATDGPQSLPVLANDLFGADYSGPGQITSVTATSKGGTVGIGNFGHSIIFTPAPGFVGTDTFTYTVDGALTADVKIVVNEPASSQAPKFASVADYVQFLIEDALQRYEFLFGQPAWSNIYFRNWMEDGITLASDDANGAPSHSETNVQVAGVDEGDIVEFDSRYIYTLTGGKLTIVDAWPADGLTVASHFDIEGRPVAEFLHGDRLTVISQVGGYWSYGNLAVDVFGNNNYWPWWQPAPSSTVITVLDVSDRSHPQVVQKTTMDGGCVDARAVGDFVYVLVNNANAVSPSPLIVDDDGDPSTLGRYETRDEYLSRVTANTGALVDAALPNYTSYGPNGELIRSGLLATPDEIYRPLVANASNLLSVVSFNITSSAVGITDISSIYGTGARTIYASLDNFYVFDADRSEEDGNVTRIMKFDWNSATGSVDFVATTTVVGTILNQFSVDESGSYLRIATTVSNNQPGNSSWGNENMLFVLQEDGGVFEFVGSLQNLALNESLQSVRFMGDRAFATTFRTIDPLFAIDLSDPAHPESVGNITLPGFTTYMQLIDPNHLLTVGRNTPMGLSGPTQVSLFDISDLTAPRRIAEYTFERFSMSEAETDHHAFGYYAELGLLAMPVSRSYVMRVDQDGDGYRETSRLVYEHQLAVFSVDALAVDPAQRLVLTGEIDHDTLVRRSGYIGDKLYSIAENDVKVVDISAPNDIVAQLTTAEPTVVVTPDVIVPLYPIDFAPAPVTVLPTPQSLLASATQRAKADLAGRLSVSQDEPVLISADAAPTAPGGGYLLALGVGERLYLYRANDQGLVQLVDDDYRFAAASAVWHTVDFDFGAPPVQMPGDFNFDNRVDDLDQAVWHSSLGEWSLTHFLPADANDDGTIDTADYLIWRRNVNKRADERHHATIQQPNHETSPIDESRRARPQSVARVVKAEAFDTALSDLPRFAIVAKTKRKVLRSTNTYSLAKVDDLLLSEIASSSIKALSAFNEASKATSITAGTESKQLAEEAQRDLSPRLNSPANVIRKPFIASK